MSKWLALLLLFSISAFGVNVSSIVVSGSSITIVAAAADGFTAGQGVCFKDSGGNPTYCAVVSSITNATTFVGLTAGANPAACASACGTVLPAPQIIVLATPPPQQGFVTYTWLNWLTTQQPCPGPTASAWFAANGSAGANSAHLAALKNGILIEHARSITVSASLPIATVESLMQQDYASDQAATQNPCQFYGFTWEPTSNAWVRQ